jgi:hypothetical protein
MDKKIKEELLEEIARKHPDPKLLEFLKRQGLESLEYLVKQNKKNPEYFAKLKQVLNTGVPYKSSAPSSRASSSSR